MVLLAIASGLTFRIATTLVSGHHARWGGVTIGFWNGILVRQHLYETRHRRSWELEGLSDVQFAAILFLVVDLLNIGGVDKMICLLVGCGLGFLVADVGPDIWHDIDGDGIIKEILPLGVSHRPRVRTSSRSHRRHIHTGQRRSHHIDQVEELSSGSSTVQAPRSGTVRSVSWEDQLPSSSHSNSVTNSTDETSSAGDEDDAVAYINNLPLMLEVADSAAGPNPRHDRLNVLVSSSELQEDGGADEGNAEPHHTSHIAEDVEIISDDQSTPKANPVVLPDIPENAVLDNTVGLAVDPVPESSLEESAELPFNTEHPPRAPSHRSPLTEIDYHTVVTPSESVLTEGPKEARLASADRLRQRARAAAIEADAYEQQRRRAIWENKPNDAFRLKFLRDDALDMSTALNRRAARRYAEAHNLGKGINTIDVHGLRPAEALKRTEKKLREAQLRGGHQLRVIVGRGLHSQGRKPILRPFIMNEIRLQNIPCKVDTRNPGVLIIPLQ